MTATLPEPNRGKRKTNKKVKQTHPKPRHGCHQHDQPAIAGPHHAHHLHEVDKSEDGMLRATDAVLSNR